MESEREDWDLASILVSDIWSPSSPDRLPGARRRCPASPCVPSSPHYLLPPASPHQLFIRHHECNNPVSADTTAVTSPSIEWRIESPPHETVVSATLVEAPDFADEHERREKPGEEQGDKENIAAETEEENEEMRRRAKEGEKAAPAQQGGGRVYEFGKKILLTSLWKRVGPEMAEKIDMAKEAHMVMLQNLTEREEMEWHMHSEQVWRVRRRKEEMYGTVQMYSLLNGVIYAAVADSSAFKCRHWWLLVALVILVALAAVAGIWVKYVHLRREKRLLRAMNAILGKLRSLTNQLKVYVLETSPGALVIDLDELSTKIPEESLYGLKVGETDEDEEELVRPSWRVILVGLLSLSVAVVVGFASKQMLCSPCPACSG